MSRTLLLVATTAVLAVAAGLTAVGTSASEDVVTRASVHRDGDHALRAEIHLQTTESTPVTVQVAGPDGEGFRVTPADPIEGAGTVPLLGLRPSRAYTVTLEAAGQTRDLGTVRTRDLPDGVPTTGLWSDSRPAGGVTLHRAPGGEEGRRDGDTLVAVDGDGQVVWYQRLPLGTESVTATTDGDLLATYHEMGVVEVDPSRGIERSWIGTRGQDATDRRGRSLAPDGAIVVDTGQMHHEVVELDDGNLLTLSREVREPTHLEPICVDSPADGVERGSEPTIAAVAADTVVEFDPETGEVVREFSLWDVLDPMDHLDRLVEDEFCDPSPEHRDTGSDVRDWTHANAIEVDERRNVVWVSLRDTDQAVGLRWQGDEEGPAGELVHRLGRDGTFELTEGAWFRQPRALEVQVDGSLRVHDRGDHRAGTGLDGDPEALPSARVVRYEIDVEAGTATQVWERRFPAEGETGWAVPRAERLPHLYPPGWQVAPL